MHAEDARREQGALKDRGPSRASFPWAGQAKAQPLLACTLDSGSALESDEVEVASETDSAQWNYKIIKARKHGGKRRGWGRHFSFKAASLVLAFIGDSRSFGVGFQG